MRVAAQRTTKDLALCLDRVRPPAPGVVVLAYHRIGGATSLELDLEPEAFAEQMLWLAEHRNVIDLDRAVSSLGETNGPATIAVTFDDGTADFIDHALPALSAAGVHATYYVATDFIESQRSFPERGTPLSWAGLAEAVSTGLVAVGSHTHRHAVMDKVDLTVATDEIVRSKELIEDRLGVPARHFAYPKGVAAHGSVARVIASHFRSAAVANSRVNHYGATDLQLLDRTPIQRSDRARHFQAKALGGMGLEGRLRAGLNRRRYRAATN